MAEVVLLVVIVFSSALLLSITGFGLALLGMPLLSWLLGIQVAAPLVALLGLSLHPLILFRYRLSFNRQVVLRLVLSACTGIPLGVWAIGHMSEAVILKLLGLILMGYALYALLTPRLPRLGPIWAWIYSFGFVAGCLGGAYNVSGPPVILYGNLRGWSPDEFKSNLQGFFLLSTLMVAVAHAVSGNLTPPVWHSYLWAMPAGLLGAVTGSALDRFFNPQTFRRVVLLCLLLLGGSLMI